MNWLFHELLYRPLFNSMAFFYDILPGADIGLAIILTTVIVRILMLPLYRASIKSQREMSVIQPIIKEIQVKYKDDKQKQSEELMKAYKEHNINPFAGIGLILVQFPILIAIYQVSLNLFKPETYPAVYSFVNLPESFNTVSFGFLQVADSRNIVFALLVGISQYYQIKLIMDRTQPTPKIKPNKAKSEPSQPDFATTLNQQMLVMMPIIVTIFAYTLPVTMSLYWLTTTIFTIGQEFLLLRQMAKQEKK